MKKVLTLTFLLYSYCVFSQTLQNDVIASAGDSDTTEQYIVSWTVGESFVETYSNTNCVSTLGFQQSFFCTLKIPELNETGFIINVYPNPTVDFINIEIQSASLKYDYEIELTDMYGHVLRDYQVINNQVLRIDLRFISTGFIIMKIIHKESSSHKTFKIVKTN